MNFGETTNFQESAMLETFVTKRKRCDVQTAVLEQMCLCMSYRNGATVSLL